MKRIYTIMFFVSMALVIASFVALAMFRLNFGVDFLGGSVVEIKFADDRPRVSDIQQALSKSGAVFDVNVSLIGEDHAIIRSNALTEADHQIALASLMEAFPDSGIEEIRFDSVGPVIGAELRQKSIRAIVVALLAIALYIAFVFRSLRRSLSPWFMSLATVIALAHDIIIPLGIFALLGKFAHIQISAVFVAALLTILGYSISDTVVVFDRVRENIRRGFGKHSNQEGEFGRIVHLSILQTLVRSVNTTLTTLLSLVAIYFFGGESIRYFALALIIGIAAGAYSSIFVAAPLLVWLSRKKA